MRPLGLLFTAAVLLALVPAPVAHADSIVTLGGVDWTINAGTDQLTLTPVVPGGNQPQNIQCVICGDNQPRQSPAFGYTNYKNAGNITDAPFFSTNISGGANPGANTLGTPYDGSFLRAYLQNLGDSSLTFSIGIDINDVGHPPPETLDSFFLLDFTTHTVLARFNPLTPAPVPSQNNGTGFPDYTLTGFDISIGGAGGDVHAGDQLVFFANLDNLTDGPDSFFFVPAPVAAVPGPAVGAGLPGMTAALGGMVILVRRRQQRRDQRGGLSV